MHGEALGELDAGRPLGVEQIEESALFGVVGLGRIAGRGANAAVFFFDQIVARKFFIAAEAPVAAGLGVQIFGERFGQPIGEGLGQDRVVVVEVAVEAGGEFVAADAGGDGERAEIIFAAAFDRRDEIGERVEDVLALALPLLPQRVEAASLFRAGLVGVEDDVVAARWRPARSRRRRGR